MVTTKEYEALKEQALWVRVKSKLLYGSIQDIAQEKAAVMLGVNKDMIDVGQMAFSGIIDGVPCFPVSVMVTSLEEGKVSTVLLESYEVLGVDESMLETLKEKWTNASTK